MLAKLEILWRGCAATLARLEGWITRHPRLTLAAWVLSLVAVAAV